MLKILLFTFGFAILCMFIKDIKELPERRRKEEKEAREKKDREERRIKEQQEFKENLENDTWEFPVERLYKESCIDGIPKSDLEIERVKKIIDGILRKEKVPLDYFRRYKDRYKELWIAGRDKTRESERLEVERKKYLYSGKTICYFNAYDEMDGTTPLKTDYRIRKRDDGTFYVCDGKKRIVLNSKPVFSIIPLTDYVSVKTSDDKYIYSSATVGGVTTGGVTKIPGKSVSGDVNTGYYKIVVDGINSVSNAIYYLCMEEKIWNRQCKINKYHFEIKKYAEKMTERGDFGGQRYDGYIKWQITDGGIYYKGTKDKQKCQKYVDFLNEMLRNV